MNGPCVTILMPKSPLVLVLCSLMLSLSLPLLLSSFLLKYDASLRTYGNGHMSCLLGTKWALTLAPKIFH